MNENKGLKVFLTIISFIVSLGLCGYTTYLSILQNWWFILPAVYFFFEAIFILMGSSKKAEYEGMKVFGIFQIVGVIVMMDYLLVMILWNDYGTMVYLLSYFVIGGAVILKALMALIAHISIHRNYHPVIHAFRNNDLITTCYLLLIIQLIIFKNIYPETSFQTHLWVYIVEISTNAVLTIFAAFLALSTKIRSKVREELSPFGKIKHTIKWFNDNEVSIYFGTIFTGYMAFLAFYHMKNSWAYVFLGIFYIVIALIRFINYLWHRSIKKRAKGNQVKENRDSSWILLFNAIVFFLHSGAVSGGAVLLMSEKITVDTNIYLFLFLIIPFAIMRLINARRCLKNSRITNNTYMVGIGYISLITAMFSILEIAAIACHTFHKTAKIIIVIILVAIIQIFVWVVCISFIVHWARSLFQNRRSREKAYLREKNEKK